VALLSTSGTTGEPKGAIQDHQAFETMIASYYATLRFDEPPVNLIVAPLTHAAGAVHYSFLPLGCTNVLLHSADPGAILAAIEKYKVSLLFLPPTIIYMMLSHPDLQKFDYSSLRYFLYGAAPMSVDKLKEAVAAFGPVMTQNYGQTEALMMVTIMTPAEHTEILENPAVAHRIASAGRPGPFSRVAILDDQGNEVARRTPGEICYQGELIMRGYFRNQTATDEVSWGGWHHSGDIGYMDEDDFVYIVDRKRDMIISGGFNVFPGEVEQAALAHPSVQDCVIVGVPHEKWGEMVMAAVELKAGASFDTEEFITFCKGRLGSVKAPKQVEIWAELPRSTVGKTLRRVVRDKYWAGHARQI
jgi:acyl-CoA synthetase (AMP-forming)/AMP-acid ligase II